MVTAMISSTVEDMVEDRTAAEAAIKGLGIFELIGAKPSRGPTVPTGSLGPVRLKAELISGE